MGLTSAPPWHKPRLATLNTGFLPKAMRIALLSTATDPFYTWDGTDFLVFYQGLIARIGTQFEMANDLPSADLILLIEPFGFKGKAYAEKLLGWDLFRQFAPKMAVINIDDFPIPFLPGAYINLPARRHQPGFTLPCGYLIEPNPFVDEYARLSTREPRFLAGFRGSSNVPLRAALIRSLRASPDEVVLTVTPKSNWFQHSVQDQQAYCSEILDSRFVFCPRGHGPSSYRCYETMRLGRVAVILSDDWAPPFGLDWPSYSLRFPEKDAGRVLENIRAAKVDWRAMGRRAQAVWENHFRPDRQLRAILESIQTILAKSTNSSQDYGQRWRSYRFWAAHDMGYRARLRRFLDRRMARLKS